MLSQNSKQAQNPDAANNRWLREAFENRIPIIYFLGIAPGRYQAILPAFISGWDAAALKARVAFGVPDQDALSAVPETQKNPTISTPHFDLGFPRTHERDSKGTDFLCRITKQYHPLKVPY